MSHKLRTPEQVCIAYAEAVAEVRRLTDIIRPSECTTMASSELCAGWPGPSTPIDPCIVTLFNIKRDGETEESYQESIAEADDNLCDRCRESLNAVEDRKEFRRRLGAAKRAVEAVGKRLKAVQP